MSFTVIRWRLAAFYPQTRLIQPFESNLSSYHLTNMNHNTTTRPFWLTKTVFDRCAWVNDAFCVWFGSRKVSARVKVPYGKASCLVFGLLYSLSIPFYAMSVFHLARWEWCHSKLAPRHRRWQQIAGFAPLQPKLRWVSFDFVDTWQPLLNFFQYDYSRAIKG